MGQLRSTAVDDSPSFERLLLVGTGALSVSFLPYWVGWVDEALPNVSLKLALTRAATKFVSTHALAALSGTEIVVDEWPVNPVEVAPHVALARWADVVAVCPATLDFVSRFALGLADSPVLLALQTTQATIGVSPALPPNALANPMTVSHLQMLQTRPNVVVTPMESAISATTGEPSETGQAPLSDLIKLIEWERQQANKWTS